MRVSKLQWKKFQVIETIICDFKSIQSQQNQKRVDKKSIKKDNPKFGFINTFDQKYDGQSTKNV